MLARRRIHMHLALRHRDVRHLFRSLRPRCRVDSKELYSYGESSGKRCSQPSAHASAVLAVRRAELALEIRLFAADDAAVRHLERRQQLSREEPAEDEESQEDQWRRRDDAGAVLLVGHFRDSSSIDRVMKNDVVQLLTEHGIQPSAQRIVVAQYVLFTDEHPSADKVWARVKAGFPMISRATVYNTLNLLVEKGLLRELHLEAHHHFIDESSGRIYDVPWEKVKVVDVEQIEGFEIRDYQVVMRGRKKSRAKR